MLANYGDRFFEKWIYINEFLPLWQILPNSFKIGSLPSCLYNKSRVANFNTQIPHKLLTLIEAPMTTNSITICNLSKAAFLYKFWVHLKQR